MKDYSNGVGGPKTYMTQHIVVFTDMGLFYSRNIQRKIKINTDESHRIKSRGYEAQASNRLVPVESYRMQLIPPAMSCNCLPGKLRRDLVPGVFIGSLSLMYLFDM